MAIMTLRVLFAGILIGLLALTTYASFERGVFDAGAGLWPDAWFRATLADAYFGFFTVFAWIAYKEQTLASRGLWFLLVMGLGNIAISTYLLIQLWRLRPGDPLERLLLRAE